MGKVSKQELSMQIDSAWQNGMNSDDMADWLINKVFADDFEQIETAPKDQPILVWFEHKHDRGYSHFVITSWDDDRWICFGFVL